MSQVDAVLLLLCVAGVVALAVGYSLHNRQVHAEHWLWKKQRLARARLLLNGGTALSALSAIAIFIV